MNKVFALLTFYSAVLVSMPAFSASNLVYCSEGSPESFNPQITLSGTARNATAPTLYNRLLDFEPGTTKLVPSLAKRWEISPDNRSYTFELRDDVSFHSTAYFTPSRKMNADDVLFSFNRQLDKEHPYHMVGGGTYQYFQGMGMDKLITKVEKLGDHRVRIELSQPEAPFLSNLAMPFMSILSSEYGEQLQRENRKADIDMLPVGTGPFKFRRYQKGTSIRYKANEAYWQGQPAIGNLVFSITPDPSVRYMKLKKGECDLVVYPSPSDIAQIKSQSGMVLAEEDGLNIGYLAMNTEKPPFDNVQVRRAIAHALNKQAYINAVYLGNAELAINPYPPSMWSHNDEVAQYEYNPEKARKLLQKAGYSDGFKVTLWTLPVSRPYNPNGRKMGEMMQQDLAKIGVEVELVSYDWGTYLDKVKRGEHDMVQLGWAGDNGDPDNFLYTLFSCDSVQRGSNNSRYCQPEFESLIKRARRESDLATREQLYREALRVFSEDVPVIPIAHSKVFRALSSRVEGYVMDPFDVDNFFPLSVSSNRQQ